MEAPTRSTSPKFLALAAVAASASLGLVACTAILGDFDVSSGDQPAADAGGGDAIPQGDGAPIGEGGPAVGQFTFAAAPASLFLQPGKTAQIAITAQRNQLDDAITVTATGLPAGVTAAPLTIAAGGLTGNLVLTAAATAVAGTHSLTTLTATAGTVTPPVQKVDVTISGPTGTLDTSFPATPPYGAGLGTIDAALAQPDGKIILIGTFHKVGGDAPALLLRLNGDGTVDTTFTGNAITTSASASPIAAGLRGLLQADGKIVVAWTEGASSKLNISRVLATGALDPNWANPSTSTVSTNGTFTTESPQVVPLAEDKNGAVVFAQTLSSTSVQGWRFNSAGVADSTLGSMGNFGNHAFSTGTSGEPVDAIDSVQGIFPQTDGNIYVLGSGTANPTPITAQILGRTNNAYVPDTTFASAGFPANGWAVGNGKANPNESVQIGTTVYTAVAVNQTCSGGQVGFCVTAFDLGATGATTDGPICPTTATGLGCVDAAVRLTVGAGSTLLVGGYTQLGGNVPVVARYKTGPLAVDTAFGATGGVTKLKAATTDETSETPFAVIAMPDGTTLVMNHDTVNPIQRVWP